MDESEKQKDLERIHQVTQKLIEDNPEDAKIIYREKEVIIDP